MSGNLNSDEDLDEFIDEEEYDHQLGPDHVIPTNEFRVWKRDGATKIIWDNVVRENTPKPISMPTALRKMVDQYGDRETLFVERNGQWISWTFKRYYEESRLIAKAFIKLGLRRLHCVAMLGYNCPEWVLSEMAAVTAGGIATGIYLTNSVEAVKFILEDSMADICLVDNDTQLQKILKVRDSLPGLKAIIQWSGKPTAPGVLSWEELLDIGRKIPDEILERRIKGISVNQPCLIVYTSGTTGNAKGALISHDNILSHAKASYGSFFNLHPEKDRIVSFLPMNHVGAQFVDVFSNLAVGVPIYFSRPDALKGSLVETLKYVRPTFFLGVPRIWEKMYASLVDAERQMGYVKKTVFKWAKKYGIKRSIDRMNGHDSKPIMYNIAEKLVLSVIKEKLGLSEANIMITGAAPTDKDILSYLHSLDLLVLEFYGLTESCGNVTGAKTNNFRLGSAGNIFPTNQVKFSEEQEICVKGRNVFMGYLNQDQQTKEVLDDEGWLHSGDIGFLDDDGYLYITGRLKELLITSGGENVAPVPIEENIKKELQEVVSNVMVIADKRKFLSVLITLQTEIDKEGNLTDNLSTSAKRWFRERQCDASTVKDILNKEYKTVTKEFEDAIARANTKALSNACRVQKFKILPRDFSLAGGELGPTLKLRRDFTAKKYESVIDTLYHSSPYAVST